MATDKLINQTQGADIIDALGDIATNVGNITYGPQTSADKVVSMTGYAKASAEAAISQGDTLNEAIGKLEKKADDNATAVADKIDKLTSATAGDIATVTATGEIADSAVAIETTLSDSSDAKVPTSKAVGTYVDGKGYAVGVSSSTANNLVAFNDANGKALKDSGIAVATSTTGLADSDIAVPTSKTVKTYVDSTATGISRYLGTITAASGLSTSAKKGDFYIVKTAWTGVHVGDELIAEKNSPSQTIDGTNWSLLHNEADTDTKYTFATGDTNGTFKVTPSDTSTAQSVPIKGLGDAAYKGVADTVSTSTDLVTANAVNTKLASYVPNSDFVVAKQNINYVLGKTGKNLLQFDLEKLKSLNTTGTWSGNTLTIQGINFVINSDNTVTATGTALSTGDAVLVLDKYPAYSQAPTLIYSGCPSGGGSSTYRCDVTRNPGIALRDYGDGVEFDTTGSSYTLNEHRIIVVANYNCPSGGVLFKPMVCTPEDWTVGHDYAMYALPNSDLTVLEAEDRAALTEIVDSGAKNLLDLSKATFGERSKITFNSDGSVTGNITDDARYWNWENSEFKFTLPAGTYVFYCKSTAGSNINWGVALRNSTSAEVAAINQYTGKDFVEFMLSSATELGFMGKIFDRKLYTMLCTKVAYEVSPKFEPYKTDPTKPWALLKSGDDLNDIVSAMESKNVYVMFATGDVGVSNKPANGIFMVRTTNLGGGAAVQEVTMLTGDDRDKSYVRTFINNSDWSAWKQTTNV